MFTQCAASPRIRYRPTASFSRLVFALCALLIGSAAHATIRCVATVNGGLDNNDAGLVNAFADANNGAEGGTWEIRLRKGIYQLSDSLQFDPAGDKDNKSFYLSGGWNSTCTDRTGKPDDSIIRAVAPTQNTPGLSIGFIGDNARYDIENIRFENFSSFLVDDGVCYEGLGHFFCPDTDTIRIDHVEFYNGGTVYISSSDARRVVFLNNLVAKIHPSGASAAVEFEIDNDEDAPQIAFNTFANIECSGAPGGVSILSRQGQVALHHNIFQTTGCTHDLYIDPSRGGKAQTPYYNLLLDAGGLVLGNLVGNGNVLNFNPLFVDAFNGNYRLQNGSPGVNKGAPLIYAIQSGFIAPGGDLDGRLRPVGTRYDIGAFESTVNDGAQPVISVNSADDGDDGSCDSSHCSLREAIKLANSQAGTAQRITFNIGGSCPRVIVLSSALPDITDPVVIDGTTQPGSAVNDLELGSDATVCVIVTPGASITHALAVPVGQPDTTRLTVTGLAFANSFFGFSTAPIELRAGSGHKISGSVFGGYMPPANNIVQVGSLGRAIYLTGTANHFTIGGDAPADRNYFGAMGENGIVMNSAGNTDGVIANNYIGVQPNGLAAQANSGDGISASGGDNVAIYDNAICASDDGISLIGTDTNRFRIQRNNIGVNAAGYGVAAHANNYGISIGLGSSQHVIGAAPGETLQTGNFSNFIDNNNKAGILMSSTLSQSTAAGFNSIRGNLIESNGRSGSGLGIQLGATQTQLPNDSADGDSGANKLQNYPIIRGSAPTANLTRSVNAALNTTPNQAVRIDFYRAATCGGSKGANATTFIGSKDVNSGPTGIVNVSATVADAGSTGYLTATATTSTGQTSELAPCVREDTIFADGLQETGL
jgi:CSLREA domain-containing protein